MYNLFQSTINVQKKKNPPEREREKKTLMTSFEKWNRPFFLKLWRSVKQAWAHQRGINLKSPVFSWTPTWSLSLLQWFSLLVPFLKKKKKKKKSSCSSLLFLWPAVCDYPHTAKNDHHNKPVGLVITFKIHTFLPLKNKMYQQGAMESSHLFLFMFGNVQGTSGNTWGRRREKKVRNNQLQLVSRRCHMIKTFPKKKKKKHMKKYNYLTGRFPHSP